MISLSGKEPGRDVAIDFVGKRAGEKLHEELLGKDETVTQTGHPKILRVTRPPIDPDWLDERLVELERLVEDGDTLAVVSRLTAIASSAKRGASAPEPSGMRSSAASRRHGAGDSAL